MRPDRRPIMCLVALAWAACPPAVAQDALGGGNLLDRNLNRTTGRFNPAAQTPDYRLRNLLVTDDVLGGRGFRGSVGYTAASDFRGTTGSDDLFSFRSNSALSSLNYINYGSTYNTLRFGQDIGVVAEYRRASTGIELDNVISGVRPSEVLNARLRLSEMTYELSLGEDARRDIEPGVLGYTADSEGNAYMFSTSPLTGVSTVPIGQQLQLVGLTSYDYARVTEDVEQGRGAVPIGTKFDPSYTGLGARTEVTSTAAPGPPPAPGAVEADAIMTRVDLNASPEFKRIAERVAERYALTTGASDAEAPAALSGLDEQMQALREELAGGMPPAAPGVGEPGTRRTRDDDEEGDTRRPSTEIGQVLRHGQRIDSLSTGDPTRFNELMASGEQRLRAGEYFWAERYFTRALRFTPGHPLATAGLAHAQLGAGLYLAASDTLRSLFSFQPEMIDTTYAGGLMPNRTRLLQEIEDLRERLEGESNRASYAFLLAYTGHLLGERDLIVEGLALMRAAEPDDEMVDLLETIWLADDGADATAPPEK